MRPARRIVPARFWSPGMAAVLPAGKAPVPDGEMARARLDQGLSSTRDGLPPFGGTDNGVKCTISVSEKEGRAR